MKIGKGTKWVGAAIVLLSPLTLLLFPPRAPVSFPVVPLSNGLEKLAGTWSQEELDHFESATAVFERVDEEEWR